MDGVPMSRKGLERRSKKYAPVQNVSVANWYMDAEDFHRKHKTGRVGVKKRMSPAAGGKNRSQDVLASPGSPIMTSHLGGDGPTVH